MLLESSLQPKRGLKAMAASIYYHRRFLVARNRTPVVGGIHDRCHDRNSRHDPPLPAGTQRSRLFLFFKSAAMYSYNCMDCQRNDIPFGTSDESITNSYVIYVLSALNHVASVRLYSNRSISFQGSVQKAARVLGCVLNIIASWPVLRANISLKLWKVFFL